MLLKNYIFKKLLGYPSKELLKSKNRSSSEIGLMVLVLLLFTTVSKSQTTLIPASEGSFDSTGGWNIANGDIGPKWVFGTAVTTGGMTGTSAYLSIDGGTTNTDGNGAYGYSRAYLYRTITPANAAETNMTLSFDVKCVGKAGTTYASPAYTDYWQVLAVPVTTAIAGASGSSSVTITNKAPHTPTDLLAGAVSIAYGGMDATGTHVVAHIPASFASGEFNLVFMAAFTATSAGTTIPPAIDNVSLISRTPQTYTSVSGSDGKYSNPLTWNVGEGIATGGTVPTLVDNVVIATNVSIDGKWFGAKDVTVKSGATLNFATFPTAASDSKFYGGFTVAGNLSTEIADNVKGAFNVYSGTGSLTSDYRCLKVRGNITNDGILDISVGSANTLSLINTTFSQYHDGGLILEGSAAQTVSGNGTFGGSVASTTNTNTAKVVNALYFMNTSTTIPNISWGLDDIRVKTLLSFAASNTVSLNGTTKKMMNWNYNTAATAITTATVSCPLGSGFTQGTFGKWCSTTSWAASALALNTEPAAGAANQYPFVSATGVVRNATLYRNSTTFPATPAVVSGEVTMTYNDDTSTTSQTINDPDAMTVSKYGANWTIGLTAAGAGTSLYTSGTGHTLAVYASGAVNQSNRENARLMLASAAAGGVQQSPTLVSPVVVRTGMLTSDLTAGAFYVGTPTQTAVASTAAGGDWNVGSTWEGGNVPSCTDMVTIVSGATVTVNSSGNQTAGVKILSGGTLISTSGDLTVGCSVNNAFFVNNGTYTMNNGTLTVNGNVIHAKGSTFNQSAGTISVDGNANGNVAKSLPMGTSTFRISTSNVAVTGGTITIVDPVYNAGITKTATVATATTLTFNYDPLVVSGMYVTGAGIVAGTKISAISTATSGVTTITVTPSQTVTGSVTVYLHSVSDYSFVYDGVGSVVFDRSHTLAFGNGVSTDAGVVSVSGITTSGATDLIGFNASLNSGALKLGNFTINGGGSGSGGRSCSASGLVVRGTFKVNSNNFFYCNGATAFAGDMTNDGNVGNTGTLVLGEATDVPSTISQTLSGTGKYYIGATFAAAQASFNGVVINNTSAEGVTINHGGPIPLTTATGLTTLTGIDIHGNGSLIMTNGIVHTNATNVFIFGKQDGGIKGISLSGNFGNTCYIDGPFIRTVQNDYTADVNTLFPVGKDGVYSPIYITAAPSGTNAVSFKAEAFTSNSGTKGGSLTNISQTRWEASLFSNDYVTVQVKVGAAGVNSSSHVAQAPKADEIYDDSIIGSQIFSAGKLNSVGNIGAASAIAKADFKGYFAYGDIACSGTPAPGNITASASAICAGTSIDFTIPGNLLGVSYQWQKSTASATSGFSDISEATTSAYTDAPTVTTYYRCKVSCGLSDGYSSVATVTVANTVTTTSASTCVGSSVTLSALAPISGTLNWYASNAIEDTTVLNTGSAYSVSPSITTTYYVSNVTNAPEVFGKQDTTNDTKNLISIYGGLKFAVSSRTVINSVDVYVTCTSNPQDIVFQLYDDATGLRVGTSYTLPAQGVGTKMLSSLELNADLQPGTYRLLVLSGVSSSNNLVASTIADWNAALVTYPSTSVTIYGSVASPTSALDNTNNNRCMFYNWFTTPQCASARVPVTATVHELPTVSTSASQVCAGSSITLSPTTGGTWTSSDTAKATVTDAGVVTTLATGDVTFTFTDATTTCSATTSTVTINALPTVSASASQVCLGSSITLSPTTGGTWTSSDTAKATVTDAGIVTTIATGDVTFTFTDSTTTCSATTSTVTINALPTVSAASQVCLGSSITLSPVSGGTWISNDTAKATVTNAGVVTTIATGEVTFTFTDSTTGCDATTSTVTINALPTVSAASQVCLGSSITLSPISGGTWISNDTAKATVTNAGVVTTIAPGDVTFTFTDSATGCDATTSTVSVVALPEVNPITGTTAIDINQTVTLSSTTSGGTWSSDNIGVATVDATTGEVTGGSQGTATISYTVTNNSCSASATTVVTVSSLANSKFDISNLKYYPNPVTDVLNISYTDEITSITLYNLLGQEVLNKAINATSATLDLSNLPSGSYMVRINAEAMVKTIKVMKQ